jgi:hypothetical protein
MMTKSNDMDEEWNIVHQPTIQVDSQGIVNGLEDLTITTTESMDLQVPSTETTKYEKQERFKQKHRAATPCPKGPRTTKESRVNLTYLDDKINELR